MPFPAVPSDPRGEPPGRPAVAESVDPSALRNRYHVLRHAQSRPNVDGRIVCRAPAGLEERNGLTERGRQQAVRSASQWSGDQGPDRPAPVIISSDFSRTRETAEILRKITDADPVRLDVRLRERDFGDHDGGPVSGYDEVWAADADGRTDPGVESAAAVQARVLAAISDYERDYDGRDIVLVSHGDTAQITQATFAGLPAHSHRSLPPLANAEVRTLNA